MARKNTINIITEITDPILGTTYKSEPVTIIPENIAYAQKQFEKVQSAKTRKARSERTKKK